MQPPPETTPKPSPALDVVTLGEAMVLLVAEQTGPLESVQSFSKRTAGAETNVAIGLARLGLRVAWASRLGDDSMGRFLRQAVQGEGVDCTRVRLVGGQRSGFMFKTRVTDGSDPAIEYHRKGSAASLMEASDLDRQWLASARHLHVTGVFPALTASTLALSHASIDVMRSAGGSVSFDPNLRPALWPSTAVMRREINALALRADWVLPGLEEGRLLTGGDSPQAIARFYRDAGVGLVVVKLGADGAYFDGTDGCGHLPAAAVETVVDTVGAGDGFAVGLISALLQGRSVAEATARGAWIGARAVQVVGDTEGLPTLRELQAARL